MASVQESSKKQFFNKKIGQLPQDWFGMWQPFRLFWNTTVAAE